MTSIESTLSGVLAIIAGLATLAIVLMVRLAIADARIEALTAKLLRHEEDRA